MSNKIRPIGHPEEFWDEIRERSSDKRYKPSDLETLLLDQAGYCCSICQAPYYEIHHIKEMKDGGKTEYDNLLVLCPNCHTRVHRDGIPNPDQLLKIKQKQEISYELPIRSRISEKEKGYLRTIASTRDEELVTHVHREYEVVGIENQQEAASHLTRKTGLVYLLETGIISYTSDTVGTVDGRTHVNLYFRLTFKGIKWVRFMIANNWIGVLDRPKVDATDESEEL